MATMNISLPDTLRDFVEAEVSAGGYQTASEYFRELIRERQKQKAEEKLEALLLEGIDSGKAVPMTAEDWSSIRSQVRERIAARMGYSTDRKSPTE